MTIKKTVEELVGVMLQNGTSLTTIQNVLLGLGFQKDKIEQTIDTLRSKSNLNHDSTETPPHNGKEETSFSLQEELKRQRMQIQSLQEEVSRLNLEFARISQEVKLVNSSAPPQSTVERIASLEATVNGIVEAIGDYVPIIIERFKSLR
jgi:predicted  nucleic acid-binding Zn-ribbon protein